MLKQLGTILISFSFLIAGLATATETIKLKAPKTELPPKAATVNPLVTLQTSAGEMTVELFQDKAPKTVTNFLKYVHSGFYDGVIFHRIIPNFMVQTGGFTQEYRKKGTSKPIINESNNLIKNKRGTLSMARTNNPNSATAQFFINLVDNSSLDFVPGRLGAPDRPGYAVFGKVIKGIEAIDKMAAQPQGEHRSRGRGEFVNAPNTPITINKAFITKPSTKKETEKKGATAK